MGGPVSYIEPGAPWENPYVESFNGRLRDEFLAGRRRPRSHSGDTSEGSAIDRSLSSLRHRLHPRHGLGEARDLHHQRPLAERRDDGAVK